MPIQPTYKKTYSRPSKRPENTPVFQSDSSGKEKDSETGYHYFGARYYNSDLSLWLSVDPMSDKYPSLSPYNYCVWNPMKIVDPDGRDGVCKVNNRDKKLVITANYYVRTGPELRTNKEMRYLYSPKDVKKIQKSINEQLNNANYTVTDGEYSGYSVSFELNFISVDKSDYDGASIGLHDYFEGVNIGNSFEKLPDGEFFGDENDRLAVGKTDKHRGIIMNSKYDNKRSRVHEIFHTLFYDNDDAPDGIGNYTPGTDYPNQNDINKMINNPNLQKVLIDE
ncbi:MAG: RHS repeat-associated core domain-containing protein [Bacteroidales bacterium]|nr:RHS repeat-associated core domain-containing protein [Bacteroidales bacterium]